MQQAIITGVDNRIDVVYGPQECAMLEERFSITKARRVNRIPPPASDFAEADYIFGTWGMPVLDADFLAQTPNLKAVFYAAGSVKAFTTEAFWESGIRLFSAWGANALPVAEFTFAQVIMCLKHAYQPIRSTWFNHTHTYETYDRDNVPGTFGTTVGLLSLGQIGRLVVERLRTLDVNVIAYDPFIKPEDARALGVKICSLEEVFAQSDVVSCHTPWLPETVKMLKREHFAAMKPGASFINTARGAVVDEDGLISVLKERPDITAVLDVTYPEPAEAGSPFYTLPNVVLTPHIAGSLNGECRRMAHYMIAEYDRMISGQPVKWELNHKLAQTMA